MRSSVLSAVFLCAFRGFAQQSDLDTGFYLYGDSGLIENHYTSSSNTNVTAKVSKLQGGQQEGTVLLTINTGFMVVTLVPTRGMNIRNVTDTQGGLLGGWYSGVEEVINPAYMNLMDRAGSGFLAGFNEMVVRCGFEYVGHAAEDGDEGLLTLHGKIANTPVSSAFIRHDKTQKKVIVEAVTYERAFKKSYFTINTTYEIRTDTTYEIKLTDRLINEGEYEAEYMALYHSNFGRPILSETSELHIPAREVSPFNDAARDGLDQWNHLFGPRKHYDETVYNIFPYANANDNVTIIAMVNRNEQRGIQMSYPITNLPALSLWKNLDLEKHGYVVGLEPGTSFSYNRKFQRPLNLVPTLAAGQSVDFSITYRFLQSTTDIEAAVTSINAILAQGGETSILPDPLSDEREDDGSDDVSQRFLLTMSTLLLLAVSNQ